MKDGPEEYNERIDFFKEFENIMNDEGDFWNLDPDKEEPLALLAVRKYCNEDYSKYSKLELQTLLKKIAMACHEILERNCHIGK